jgi:tetratricopeptide (TPR) repeat protein
MKYPLSTVVATGLSALLSAAPAFAVPDGPLGELTMPGAAAAPDGAMAARLAYNLGYDEFEKAQAKEKQGAKADALRPHFTAARVKFEEATKADPALKEAWNLVGYTSRRLGDYDRSLAAYEKALALDPSYGEAIEYRAEAYLALNRIDEAKSAYLGLLASARNHADVLMDAMRRWVADHRRAPGGVAAADIDAFAKWVEERGAIAQQTASLNLDRSVVRRWD